MCPWRLFASIVSMIAMPTLPPMLRIRLNRLVALPICSRGIAVHRDRRQRHEQQAERDALDELRPEDVPVAGLQVQLRRARTASTPPIDEPERQQLARVDLRDEQADQRHRDERPDAARRHRDPGLQRRIAAAASAA